MKRSFTRSETVANYLVAAVLVGVPFHAFLTIWGSTLFGHYTALRLWDDACLAALIGICGWWLVQDSALRQWFTSSLLVRLILSYAGLTILLGAISYAKHDVSLKALLYGVLINLRFLAWFLAVFLASQRSPLLRRYWPRLLMMPAAVIMLFAGLQYTLLPHDFLRHFGYNSATTIAPIETINHNARYIRVQSTLRGANPLGAYLVLVIAALGSLCTAGRRRWLCLGLSLLALFGLYATGSRSAWIGTLLALGVVAWSQLRSRRARLWFGGLSVAFVLLAAGAYLLFKNNVSLENAVLHTQQHSQVKTTSNAAHASALNAAVHDVLHQPFGDGPGTAGPASEYNAPHAARIAENYYLQVAQETGWLGLALFLGVLLLVASELVQRRRSRLALALFAGLVGVSFVNLLSHAWADDTLAYLWWGLAGIALSVPPKVMPREV